jgi:hypothetical protein
MIAVKPSATSPTSSNNKKPEKASLLKPWQQIWATVKSSTRRLLGFDDRGLQ